MTIHPQTDSETARLHDEILTLKAELATMRGLLRTENQRANDAIDREETAEEAALEAEQERDQLRAGLVAVPPTTTDRDRIRRVLAQVDGFDFDLLEPHDYQIQAAALLAVLPPNADRAAVLREAADAVAAMDFSKLRADFWFNSQRDAWDCGQADAEELLRRLADEAQQQPETQAATDVVAAIVDALEARAGELQELAEEQMRPSLEERAQEWHEAANAARRAAKDATAPAKALQPFVPPAHYRRDDGVDCCVHTIPVGPDSCRDCRELADDAPAVVSAVPPQPEETACGPAPDACDVDGEPCANHEREQSHAEGDHSLCRRSECEVIRQS